MTALKSKKVLLLAVVATIAGLVTGSSINASTIQYEYDALNRLIRVTYDDGTKIVYRYDPSGNRSQKVVTVLSDLDVDGDVDLADLSILAEQWLSIPGEPSADIAPWPETDNIVNLLDMAVLANHWLSGTTP